MAAGQWVAAEWPEPCHDACAFILWPSMLFLTCTICVPYHIMRSGRKKNQISIFCKWKPQCKWKPLYDLKLLSVIPVARPLLACRFNSLYFSPLERLNCMQALEWQHTHLREGFWPDSLQILCFWFEPSSTSEESRTVLQLLNKNHSPPVTAGQWKQNVHAVLTTALTINQTNLPLHPLD